MSMVSQAAGRLEVVKCLEIWPKESKGSVLKGPSSNHVLPPSHEECNSISHRLVVM